MYDVLVFVCIHIGWLKYIIILYYPQGNIFFLLPIDNDVRACNVYNVGEWFWCNLNRLLLKGEVNMFYMCSINMYRNVHTIVLGHTWNNLMRSYLTIGIIIAYIGIFVIWNNDFFFNKILNVRLELYINLSKSEMKIPIRKWVFLSNKDNFARNMRPLILQIYGLFAMYDR